MPEILVSTERSTFTVDRRGLAMERSTFMVDRRGLATVIQLPVTPVTSRPVPS